MPKLCLVTRLPEALLPVKNREAELRESMFPSGAWEQGGIVVRKVVVVLADICTTRDVVQFQPAARDVHDDALGCRRTGNGETELGAAA
jgi:hypothetical protein